MAKKRKRKINRRPLKASNLRASDFNPDYSAIKKDLRSIGKLASFFIIVLIVLSFILR
ncbi:MAG: hypothetical protein QGM50_03270 [Anaerolineae bacterium]|nr:hypothetical protein [Anaerolineae bacterium]MDK1081139.1 hypothetical protein [Anaerolineae bacterium]MDK1117791.1 hypothetical protein [Anaerolineae bacterium]